MPSIKFGSPEHKKLIALGLLKPELKETRECITETTMQVLSGLINAGADKKSLLSVLEITPLCQGTARRVVQAPAKRGGPWGISPIYVDAAGNSQEFDTPGDVVRFLELPESSMQCDLEGKECRANSHIDILRIQGYTVSGDGEPRKRSEGGTKLIIYHPDAIQETET